MRVKDEQKYDAICDAAIDLINETGFANASMSKIAKRAGVSPATIYIYFENKNALLNKLYLRTKYEMSRRLNTSLDDTLSLEEQFKGLFHNFYLALKNDKRSFEFIEQFINSPLINEVSRKEAYRYFKGLDELFSAGVEQGIIRSCSIELIHSFSFGVIVDLIKKHHTSRFVMSEKEVAFMIDLIWNTISL